MANHFATYDAYVKKFVANDEYTFGAMCYYKGWRCPLMIGDKAVYLAIKKRGEETILDGFRMGHTISNMIEIMTETLDRLVTKFFEKEILLPEDLHIIMYYSVAALLKMKAMPIDNDNGFHILYKFVEEKTDTETLEECCICLEDKRINWRCRTCKSGLVCNGCRKKLKHSCVGCPVCRSI